MNKELSGKIFKIPKHILDHISNETTKLNGEEVVGLDRAENLLKDRTVTYGQLKRIIHDMNTMDKLRNKQQYELAGGDLMFIWSNNFLKGERDLIKSRKKSKKDTDEMIGMTGERGNSYLKKHKKKSNFNIGTGGTSSLNFMKSNSHKNSVSPIMDFKLNEEIEKIKKLIAY